MWPTATRGRWRRYSRRSPTISTIKPRFKRASPPTRREPPRPRSTSITTYPSASGTCYELRVTSFSHEDQHPTRVPDEQQLVNALDLKAHLVTHNYRDFVLLHRAWLLWTS